VTIEHLKHHRVLLPPPEVRQRYIDILAPIDAKTEINEQESQTLAELRDTLLPKLISGELRVPQAEEMVEEVT
jgi:type I restriction enzyme S subunit